MFSWLRMLLRAITAIFVSMFLIKTFPLQGHEVLSTISEPTTGITITMNPSGVYSITSQHPAWTFGGNLGHAPTHIAINNGIDRIGRYQEIAFRYESAREGSMRTYAAKPVVLFSTTYLAASHNVDAFPALMTYPHNLYHLSYNGLFGMYGFNLQGVDSPWLFFDAQANSFLLSPASHFMVANTLMHPDGSITSGINAGISELPSDFTQQTMLVIGQGINATYGTWGQAMMALQGKVRPPNDADVSLNTLGYWTDHGAYYYYNTEPTKSYEDTLLAVKDDFRQRGIPLGYMQLDSWWYPKGSSNTWQGNGLDRGGEYTYTAAPELFPDGLAAFQHQLDLPLITHGRWIDASSPYRSQYTMSNDVSTDPRFWKTIMAYIKDSGVMTYEQDWLANHALPANNLIDAEAFMHNMADAASEQGLTLQYCMPLPRHYLEGTMYPGVVTMRVSDDRFERRKWDQFLYQSRLGSALGIWPWSDVFMSTETDNLLLSTLSGGMVGVGDRIGTESIANLMQTVRPDGVIVKPDAAIVPTDATYIGEARGAMPPMVATTYTDQDGLRDAYVFAYKRGPAATQPATFSPNDFGVAGRAYVYNYFTRTGAVIDAGQRFSDTVSSGSYYIVAPIGPSGIAFLGDAGKFVALGHKRISHLSDNGTIQATLTFASGEGAITVHGYAPVRPNVSAENGSVGQLSYDTTSHLFSFSVTAGAGDAASIRITPGS